jgi:hypothetical protein
MLGGRQCNHRKRASRHPLRAPGTRRLKKRIESTHLSGIPGTTTDTSSLASAVHGAHRTLVPVQQML